jgi:hypothetical protein
MQRMGSVVNDGSNSCQEEIILDFQGIYSRCRY